jgi:hypothetical protein
MLRRKRIADSRRVTRSGRNLYFTFSRGSKLLEVKNKSSECAELEADFEIYSTHIASNSINAQVTVQTQNEDCRNP